MYFTIDVQFTPRSKEQIALDQIFKLEQVNSVCTKFRASNKVSLDSIGPLVCWNTIISSKLLNTYAPLDSFLISSAYFSSPTYFFSRTSSFICFIYIIPGLPGPFLPSTSASNIVFIRTSCLNLWPISFFRLLIKVLMRLIFSPTLLRTYSWLTRSIHLYFIILLQHHISRASILYFSDAVFFHASILQRSKLQV